MRYTVGTACMDSGEGHERSQYIQSRLQPSHFNGDYLHIPFRSLMSLW